jgi:hypothetical protein
MRSRDTLATLIAATTILGLVGLAALMVSTGAGHATQPTATPDAVVLEQAAPQPVQPEPTPPAEGPAEPVRAVPLHVRIGAITVDAPVVSVGLKDDGAMEIPDRVAEIGWYDPDELGVTPGSSGTAVLAGHVDSRTQGRGALYFLRDLRVGEIVELDLSDGTTQRWIITDVIRYPKDVLPFSELFVWSGPPRLALITCGGTFDRTARSYTDNIVAYAEPLEPLTGAPPAPTA